MKSITKSFLIIAGTLLIFYLGYQIVLFRSINRSSNEAAKESQSEFFKEEFSGIIRTTNPQKLDCYLILYVLHNNHLSQFESFALCPCHNQNFMDFIADGDSIVKGKNTDSVLIFKNQQKSKKFLLPICK
jgi:hypothetical protein